MPDTTKRQPKKSPSVRRLSGMLRRALWSALSAILIIAATYIIDSSPYPTGDEVTIEQWVERLNKLSGIGENNIPDSVCLINITYDKAMADCTARLFDNDASSAQPVGQIPVTDRRKLLDFLTIADSLNNYRYIMLDVRFDDDIADDTVTEALFRQISSMDNIVFARHQGSRTADGAPMDKAAFGDYHTTFLVFDVVKYPVLKADGDSDRYLPSIPAKMYHDLQGVSFTTRGPLTFSDGHLCRRSIYPTLPVRMTSWAVTDPETGLARLQYKNLGTDLLSVPNRVETIGRSIDNKIVVVGDFVDDTHDTYIGQQAGTLVNLNSYIALCHGSHLVSLTGTLVQFLLFFALSLSILSGRQLLSYIPFLRKSRNGIVHFVASYIGFTVVLAVAAAITYMLFGFIFSIVFPSLYLSIFETCAKFRK